VLWPLGALLVGAAAVHPATRIRTGTGSRAAGRLARGGRVVVALPALAVLVCDQHVHRLSTAAVDLALAALVLLVARLALSLRENQRLLAASRREALTDALTGLGNRRALMGELDRALALAEAGEPQVLALFDLDGFKRYNDAFGHVAGDLLIELLGSRLSAAVPRSAPTARCWARPRRWRSCAATPGRSSTPGWSRRSARCGSKFRGASTGERRLAKAHSLAITSPGRRDCHRRCVWGTFDDNDLRWRAKTASRPRRFPSMRRTAAG
jgi:hypothetical protein